MIFSRLLLLPLITISLLSAAYSIPSWAVNNSKSTGETLSAIVPETFPPYYQLNEKGEIEGFAIDMMNAVSKRAGFKVEYEIKKTWSDVFREMKEGKADLIPNVGATESREKYLDFTHSVETFRISLFIRKESAAKFTSKANLSGKSIGAVKSNVGYKVLLKLKDFRAVAFDSFEQAYYALLSGQIDALAYPEAVTWNLLSRANEERRVEVLGEPLAEIKRVIGVRKGEYEILSALNVAIDELIASEEYVKIYNHWFSRPPLFWTKDRVVIASSLVFLIILIVFSVWRYYLLIRHKRELSFEVKERTKKLNDTNKLLQDVLDAAPLSIFWKNLDNVFLGCNKNFTNDAGVNQVAEVIGKTDFDFNWRDRAELYQKDDSDVMRSGQSRLQYEEPQTTPNGNTIWIETSKVPLQNNDGEIYGVLGIYHDITPRKKLEEVLRESKDTYASAEMIAHIGSWRWTIDTGVVTWSDEIFRIFGIKPQSVAVDFELFMKYVYEDDKQMVLDAVNEAIGNPQAEYNIIHRFMQDDSTERFIHQQGKVYRDADGKPVRMIGTTHDITEQKKYELEMIKAKDEAEKASQAKSLFLSNMSHELRTPLHGILSYAKFGQSKAGAVSAEKIKKYFDQINSSGERLKILLDDLLDISKLEAGKMEMYFTVENIQQIIEDCVSEQQALIYDRGLSVVGQYETSELLVECDKNRIGQIIMNLLSNAIKFSPDNTEIAYKIMKHDSSANQDDEAYVQISISDQGKGVAEKDREVIFDKFVQSDENENNFGGTGLGLAITRELIHTHNGEIWCQKNNDGVGAEFVFRLPVKQNKI